MKVVAVLANSNCEGMQLFAICYVYENVGVFTSSYEVVIVIIICLNAFVVSISFPLMLSYHITRIVIAFDVIAYSANKKNSKTISSLCVLSQKVVIYIRIFFSMKFNH